ncbi:hypothetical protein KJ632_00455 [Patescibacteria group bacterium]|nr:hypothetical protein [Patescibacteria group bacterium]
MRKKLQYLLSTTDLKPEESKIYLLLLKLNSATIQQLSAQSGISEMSTYRAVKRLQERDMVEAQQLNKKQSIYQPLSLQKLIQRINHKQKKLARLANSLKDIDPLLPYLDLNEELEDSIEIKEGLDSFREEYLKLPRIAKDEFICMGSMEQYWAVNGWDLDAPEEASFIRQRMHKGVYARVANIRSEQSEYFHSRDSLEKRTTKIKDDIPMINNYFTITENQSNLFICNKENPRVIITKQPELLNLQKAQFSELWKK